MAVGHTMLSDASSGSGNGLQRSWQQSFRQAVGITRAVASKKSELKDKGQTSSLGEYTLLILLTLLAAGLRFYKLGEWSYFIDEFHTLESIGLFFSATPLGPLFRPNSRAAFWLLTKLSLMIFGESAFSLRFFPYIFGTLTIPLVYCPIKHLFNKYVALISVFIIAVSPWHIYMSQMGRWYTLSLLIGFFAIISFNAFIESGKKKHFALYILLTYFGITLHMTGFFVPMIAVAYMILLVLLPQYYQTGGRKRLLFILGLHAIFCLAYIPRFLDFMGDWADLEGLVGSWGSDFALKVLYHITPSLAFSSIAGLFLLATLRDRRGLFLAAYCMVPFIALSLFALADINVSARYQLFTLPAVSIAAAFTITYLRSMLSKSRNLLALAMFVIVILPSFQTDYLYFTSEYGYRHRSNEVFQYIKERMAKDDQVFVAGVYPAYEERFYAESLIRSEGIDINDGQLITSSLDRLDLKKRAWVVTLARAPEKPEGFQKWIAEHTHLLAEFPTRRAIEDQTLKVYLYSP
jgi:hypothetical protein